MVNVVLLLLKIWGKDETMDICLTEHSKTLNHTTQTFRGCCVSTGVTDMESERLSPASCPWMFGVLEKDVRQ